MKIAFTPAIYEHAARLIGRSPYETSRDPDLLFAGHRAAWLEYHHTPIAVGIDIYNLEAEAYGAKIAVPDGNDIPAIHEPVFKSLDGALKVRPFDPARDGRLAMVIGVGQRLKKEFPQAEVRIPVAGPFSIAFNLVGISHLVECAAERPEETREFLWKLAENQGTFCKAVVDAGLDVAFFESAAAPPLLSPRLFREVELPALKHAVAVAESQVRHPLPCIMGGDTFKIFDELMSTGTNFVVINPETNQAAFVARLRAEFPNVRVRVNMQPHIVICNDRAAIYREVDRILALADGYPNCVLGTGALPYEAPPENVHLIREYVA